MYIGNCNIYELLIKILDINPSLVKNRCKKFVDFLSINKLKIDNLINLITLENEN